MRNSYKTSFLKVPATSSNHFRYFCYYKMENGSVLVTDTLKLAETQGPILSSPQCCCNFKSLLNGFQLRTTYMKHINQFNNYFLH